MIHRLSYLTKWARPCIAVAAAYAFALQVLLASVIAAGAALAPPQADSIVICISGSTDDGTQPAHAPDRLADCVLSCVQGLSGTAILPSSIPPAFVFVTANAIEHSRSAAFVLSPRPSPRLAQAPPQIA